MRICASVPGVTSGPPDDHTVFGKNRDVRPPMEQPAFARLDAAARAARVDAATRAAPRPRQADRWLCSRLHRRVTVMAMGPPPVRPRRERDRVQQKIEVATMTTQSIGDTERRFAAHEHRDLALGLAYIGETIERSRAFSSTELWARLHHTMGWLEHELRPHLTWEATVALPGVRRHRRDAVGDQASALRAPPDRGRDCRPPGRLDALVRALDTPDRRRPRRAPERRSGR